MAAVLDRAKVAAVTRRRSVLQQRRKAVGHSQESLAEALGIDRSTVARWESGSTSPQPWQRPRLADVLGVTVDDVEVMFSPRELGRGASDNAGAPPGSDPAPTAPTERTYELYMRGQGLLAANNRADIETARALLDRAVQPDSLDATVTYARALNNAGLSHLALPLLSSVLAVDPTNPSAVKLSVWCHMLVGNYAHAVNVSRTHLARHPNDANTRWATSLASSYIPGQLPQAVSIAEEATEIDPDDLTLWVLLGYLHRRAGGEAQAHDAWSAGLERAYDGGELTSPRALAWAGNLHAALGDAAAADETFDRIAESEPHNSYLAYRSAHVLAELGRVDQAIGAYRRAVDLGFLSVQLAKHEEVLALAPLTRHSDYRSTVRLLEAQVAKHRYSYAGQLPAAPLHPRQDGI